MSYLGRATGITFETKLNGTHTLTFQLPDRYFDSEKGDYVRNEFVDNLFNERKIKLKFMGEWYEFYIKSVSDSKQFKSYMKKYSCSDAFIDELSRNGYGITFDTELYNNVEEIGTFSRVILEDSIWSYAPEHNWGDFTEYLEEKLFKIPVGGDLFPTLVGHKLYYNIDKPRNEEQIINVFTKEKRGLEMGDDLAAAVDGKGGYFWDAYDGSMPLMSNTITNIPNDGYIYVPYSQLEFCYQNTSDENYAATEEVCYYDNKSYAIAPNTVDPTALIQFIAIPKGAEIEIDEAGLIVNKDYTYVMTVKEWNEHINSKYYYQFLPIKRNDGKKFYEAQMSGYEMEAVGNMAAYYEGYLDKINDIEVLYGKKISISDRTEVNITEDIDQYVKVYNQKFNSSELKDLYTNPDGLWQDVDGIEYRVCSKTETRQIIPQLARNYLQNGTKIKSTDGWEPCKIFAGDEGTKSYFCSNLQMRVGTTEKASSSIETYEYVTEPENTFLQVIPSLKDFPSTSVHNGVRTDNYLTPTGLSDKFDYYNTIINFGIVGQEKKIIKDMIYCLGIKIGLEEKYRSDTGNPLSAFEIRIGEGKVVTNGEYDIICPANASSEEESTGICLSLQDIVTFTGDQETIRVKSTDGRDTEVKQIDIYEGYIFIKFDNNIDNPYYAITAGKTSFTVDQSGTYEEEEYTKVTTSIIPDYYLFNSYLFEAYTKGVDQFISENEDEEPEYRYSGRELYDLTFRENTPSFIVGGIYNCSITDMFDRAAVHAKIIFEEDVMPGDTYAYQKYFIQQVIAYQTDEETGIRTGRKSVADTFAQKEILSDYADLIAFKNTNISHNDLPYSAAQFNDDDIDIATKYIDLNKCKYYNKTSNKNSPDCSYGGDHLCLYQKYGYCPYLFETEKHCRKIRTLNGEKSNRFNLTQELSKVFEIYPIYWTEHYENGKIKTDTVECDEETKSLYGTDTYERMRKKVFYIKEKGMENKLGFRYEKNLSSISRDIKSDQIVTKLYVADVDSDLSKTGLCSIKTAEDNPSKDSFIIDFRYYTTKGILDKDSVDADLYGKGEGDYGYLKQLGYLNTEYDKLSNAIINLSTSSLTELQANVETNVKGIETAQKQLFKLKKGIAMYESKGDGAEEANKENQSYQNQITKYNEQLNILNNLIYETFFDQVTDEYLNIALENNLTPQPGDRAAVVTFFDDEGHDIKWMQESPWFKQHTYNLGMLGQYNREYLQIAEWKKKQAYYLKEINKLAIKFFRKYEPYLKEGTWTDSNYISDNAYYFGACEVAAEGAIPKVSYNISVVDLYALPEYEDYKFNIADTTYVEDIGMFGINKITGLPNKLKVIISGITYNLDEPSKNTINVQNFTTQFADLFQQVTASVQSLTFNENIYKRASNFTSNQNIDQESLQGTLDTNEMQLIKTAETNIEIDKQGQSGSDINNHSNKYRLNGQGMEFSNNGGETWNVGVGPGGINADYINVGTLDAGKIRIVDNNYLYFLWDKNGISAFRDPQSISSSESDLIFNDYALFNRYGLSLVEKGLIRLRAGYSFNGLSGKEITDAGKISTETTQGEDVGFYLYNAKGVPIFSTSTNSLYTQDADNMTARITLKGEMYVSDDVYGESSTSYKYSYTDKYVFSNISVYSLEELAPAYPDETDYFDIQVVNYDLAYCANYFVYHILKGHIPINTDWENTPLKVTSADSVEHYIYVIGDSINNVTGNAYLKNNQYYINNQITKLSLIAESRVPISGTDPLIVDQASEEYILEGNDIYKKTMKTISYVGNGGHSPNDNYITVQPLSVVDNKAAYVYEANVNPLPLTNLGTLFMNGNTGYTQQIIIESGTPSTLGATALYINNKIAWEPDEQSGNQRLFCCARDDTEGASNLFTIKKDGSLYMGGRIYDMNHTPVSSKEISDEVQVDNADIYIKNGIMYVDFHKIIDPNTGRPLDVAIADAVASIKLIRHKHEIRKLTGAFSEEGKFAYLPTEADLSQGFNLDGVPERTLGAYLDKHPNVGFLLMAKGETTIFGANTSHTSVRFSNRIPIAGEQYTFNCVNSYTEDAGSSEGGGGGASGGTFNGWGFVDPIQT